MTEKLYYIDSHMKAFTATVTSCEQNEDRFEVTLDRTAFFPEGGGQLGDSGVIGGVRVFDTHEKNGEIKHYVNPSAGDGQDLRLRHRLGNALSQDAKSLRRAYCVGACA